MEGLKIDAGSNAFERPPQEETASPALPDTSQASPDGVSSNPVAEAEQHITAAAASPTELAAATVTLRSLFGPYFEAPREDRPLEDPAVVDVDGVVLNFFGKHVSTSDVDSTRQREARRELAACMNSVKMERDYMDVERLFGVHGSKIFLGAFPETSTMLRADLPEVPPASGHEELWLVNMPKIDPNRQVLHAAPQPFNPAENAYVESNPRMLYTPSNVMRWAYLAKTDTPLSNSRMVRWSDGSTTLHIGTDVFSFYEARDPTYLDLLATPSSVRAADDRGAALPALVSTVNPDRHFIMEATGAVSVEKAIVSAGEARRSAAQVLPFASEPVLNVNWKKPSAEGGVLEEYVALAYQRREAEMRRREREGNPMTLAEQIELEAQLDRHLRSVTAEQLRAEQDVARSQQRERDAASAANRQQKRHRMVSMVGGDDSRGGDDDYLSNIRRQYQRGETEDGEAAPLEHGGGLAGDGPDSEAADALTDSVEALLHQLSPVSNTYGAVESTLNMIRSGTLPLSFVETEIPQMAREVRQEAPDADLTEVESAFRALFNKGLDI